MILFHPEAWENYLYWQQIDKQMPKRLNALIKECQRTPFSGTGRPEPLKGDLRGFWSRRIDGEHRLVYSYEDGNLIIASCRYHYSK